MFDAQKNFTQRDFEKAERITVSAAAEDLENHICTLNFTSGQEKIAELFRKSQDDLEDSERK
ncbi:hypothetical protein CHS0354_036288 [Potamilus streckersoni]|uniref:Uncharacterized protein n=1 Tax=Potamilus streckersoni TaxID=2493646 RepID=A0AAE0T672_9BIVA|nr:hypothetical protein CHS0354_036288 [Potamilus streckersoni]